MAFDHKRRIRGLLAKADRTEFPLEAEALRARAEKLMRTHGITRADLVDKPPPPVNRPRVTPQGPMVVVVLFDEAASFRFNYSPMANTTGTTGTVTGNHTYFWPG